MHAARPISASRRRTATSLGQALADLVGARRPLFREMAELAADPHYQPSDPADHCCRRPHNRMRLSTLEALAIARAFRTVPALAARRAEVIRRTWQVSAGLEDTEERQTYDCPLLEDGLCLVHHHAKPIACLAWNEGVGISVVGLRALARRDLIHQRMLGSRWALQAIPLLLAPALAGTLARTLPAAPGGKAVIKRARPRGRRGPG